MEYTKSMFGSHKEVMTIEFGGRNLVVPERDDPNPCTEDLIWRSHLYPPMKLPSLKDLAVSCINLVRRRFVSGKTQPTLAERDALPSHV